MWTERGPGGGRNSRERRILFSYFVVRSCRREMAWVSVIENNACLKDPGVAQLRTTLSALVAVNVVLGLVAFVIVPVLFCFRFRVCACVGKNEGKAARRTLERMAQKNGHSRQSQSHRDIDMEATSRKLLRARLEARSRTSRSPRTRTRSSGGGGLSTRVRKVREYLESVGCDKVTTIVDPDGTGIIELQTLSRVFRNLALPAAHSLLARLPGVRPDGTVRTVAFLNWIFAGSGIGGGGGGKTIPPLPPRRKGAGQRSAQVSPRRSKSL